MVTTIAIVSSTTTRSTASPPTAGQGAWEIERLTFDTTRPNGLLLSWDERTLFLAQSDYDAGSVRQLRAYPIDPMEPR